MSSLKEQLDENDQLRDSLIKAGKLTMADAKNIREESFLHFPTVWEGKEKEKIARVEGRINFVRNKYTSLF